MLKMIHLALVVLFGCSIISIASSPVQQGRISDAIVPGRFIEKYPYPALFMNLLNKHGNVVPISHNKKVSSYRQLNYNFLELALEAHEEVNQQLFFLNRWHPKEANNYISRCQLNLYFALRDVGSTRPITEKIPNCTCASRFEPGVITSSAIYY